tara:strand:+ start:118 stop:1452 length:1335 start_codon:yes stop_codon:yes gene_type:complete
MFISTSTIIFLPIIKPILIGKMPLIYLVNLYFLICYLGIFLFDKYKILTEPYDVNDHTAAINTLFLGYSFFLIGYFFFRIISKKFERKPLPYLETSISESFLIGMPLLISVIIFFYFINIQNYFVFLRQLKYILLLFSIGICFDIILKENLKSLKLYFLLILIILPIFFELLQGSFNFPFMIMIIIYTQYVVNRKNVNVFLFLIIGFLFLIVHSGKYDYRKQTWHKENLDLSLIDKSKAFFNNYFKDDEVIIVDGNLQKKEVGNLGSFNNYKLERRIFHSYWSLLIVTKNSPKKIPYWQGYSYQILKTKIIPRVFWKNKPSDILGNEFGHRYNVLTPDSDVTKKDNHTSWNMPVLNEFYVNFGNIGVLIGMFIMGVLINLLTKLGSFRNNSNLEAFICFYLFVPLFFFESHLSLLFGAIIQSYIFLLIISFCCLFFLRKVILFK